MGQKKNEDSCMFNLRYVLRDIDISHIRRKKIENACFKFGKQKTEFSAFFIELPIK